jgi:hypothetical protein
MSVNTILTDYSKMYLPTMVDANVAAIPAGTYNPYNANGTYFTLPGIYGKGDIVTNVSPFAATLSPDYFTVEFRSATGVVGTLYNKLGTSVCLPGSYLGKPLEVDAWIQVSATAVGGTCVASGSDAKMVVTYVHMA